MLRWKNPNSSLSLMSWNVGSMARHSKENFELLVEESPHVLFLQEARTTPHELRAMKHRFREVVYFVLWDARRELACIARHGLNSCQIRGPECVEGCKLGYYALQLRDTRVPLRNVHYPFEGPSERAKLEQELESVDIARCLIDLGHFNSQPARRIGDHVLMPNVKTWRKNAGSSTFASCVDGACQTVSVVLATISALEPVSGVQHRPVKLVVHVQPLTSCCYKWVRGKHSPGVSNWDQSSMAHLRELMDTDIDAAWKFWHLLVGGSAFPSRILRQCPWSSGWGSGSESERVARLWRRRRQARARKTGEDDCRADSILEEISRILSENSKLAIAKWRHEKSWSCCSMGQEPIHCWCRPATSCELGR